ncbi:MAG: hypothetical protein SGI97_03980 [candidate division Zixibacteria bacterium]|nr:hypothetical protein [candidate division Zixibacteria bacterium]
MSFKNILSGVIVCAGLFVALGASKSSTSTTETLCSTALGCAMNTATTSGAASDGGCCCEPCPPGSCVGPCQPCDPSQCGAGASLTASTEVSTLAVATEAAVCTMVCEDKCDGPCESCEGCCVKSESTI